MTTPNEPAWITGQHTQHTSYQTHDATLKAAFSSSSLVALTDMVVYGNSYDQATGLKCTSGRESHNVLKSTGALTSSTTYGIGGFRAVEAAFAAIGGKNSTGATLPAGTRGIVWINVETNDMFSPTVNSGSTAGALTSGLTNVFKQSIRTICALASASARYEAPGAATNWSLNSITDFSGGTLLITTTPGATVDTAVTVPASGVIYALTYFGTNNGDHQWKIGSTVIGQLLAADAAALFAQVTQTSAFATRNYAPVVVKLSGLTPGAATITTVKTDAGAGAVFADAFLAPSATPPLILLEKAPLWNTAASAPHAAVTVSNMPTVTANKATLDAVIDGIANSGEFPTAVSFDALLTPTTDLGTDGLHPNDTGMRKRATAALVAANAKIIASGGYLAGLNKTL